MAFNGAARGKESEFANEPGLLHCSEKPTPALRSHLYSEKKLIGHGRSMVFYHG
jgi:hypothetical protein